MQEKKEVLRGRSLRTAYNSFLGEYTKTLQFVDDYRLGTRNIVKVIEPCVKNHAENPKFPAEELREGINGLRMAVETRNVHQVHTYRERIESLLSPWKGRSSDIIIGS